jgi:plasmid stabilization system protein ParE
LKRVKPSVKVRLTRAWASKLVDISFSKSALSDLEEIKAYYLKLDILAIGADLVISIVEHTETLVDYPEIGRVVPEFTRIISANLSTLHTE